jgi:hypothetical protein
LSIVDSAYACDSAFYVKLSEDFHMFQFIENLINTGSFNFEDLSSTS